VIVPVAPPPPSSGTSASPNEKELMTGFVLVSDSYAKISVYQRT